ncbi:hypothetical protein OC834_007841, partial [Tilletia horrida]
MTGTHELKLPNLLADTSPLPPPKNFATKADCVLWVEALVLILRPLDICPTCKKCAGWAFDQGKDRTQRIFTHTCSTPTNPNPSPAKICWKTWLNTILPRILETRTWIDYGQGYYPQLQTWVRQVLNNAEAIDKQRLNKLQAQGGGAGLTPPSEASSTTLPSPDMSPAATHAAKRIKKEANSAAFTTPRHALLLRGEHGAFILSSPSNEVASSQPVSDLVFDKNDAPQPESESTRDPVPKQEPGSKHGMRRPAKQATPPADAKPAKRAADPPVLDADDEDEWAQRARTLEALATGDLPTAAHRPELAWWSGIAKCTTRSIYDNLERLGLDTSRILRIRHSPGVDYVAEVVFRPGSLANFQVQLRSLGIDQVFGGPMALSILPPHEALFPAPALPAGDSVAVDQTPEAPQLHLISSLIAYANKERSRRPAVSKA